jgi:hypothetical protein
VLGGVLGAGLLPAPLLGMLGEVVLPEVPPAAPVAPVPEPKCSSHSAREIWPSLFLSTAEKLGACELAPAAAEPLALGDCGLSCAMETLARANSAAAVAVLMSFNIGTFLLQEVG